MTEFFVRDRGFYTSFFAMTATIAMQSAIVFSVNLADAVMLSRYTETALAGVALLNQIQFLLQMLVFGVAEGALIFSSRSWGEHRLEPIRDVTSIALKFGVAIAILMSIAILVFPEPGGLAEVRVVFFQLFDVADEVKQALIAGFFIGRRPLD